MRSFCFINYLFILTTILGCVAGNNNVQPLLSASRTQSPVEKVLTSIEFINEGASTLEIEGANQTQFRARALDQNASKLSGIALNLVIPTDGGSVLSVQQTTDAQGEIVWVLDSSTKAGSYDYKVTSVDYPTLQSNTRTLIFSAGALSQITLSSNEIVLQSDATETLELKAVARDQYNNYLDQLSLSLNIPANGGSVDNIAVTTNAQGEAFWTLTSSTIPEYYEYSVTSGTVTSNNLGVLFKDTTRAFITKWKTDNTAAAGSTNNNQIMLPLIASANYKAIVDWGDGQKSIIIDADTESTRLHTYENPGTYEVKIEGIFERFVLHNGIGYGVDDLKLVEVVQWGDIKWKSMQNMFFGAANLRVTATDAPDLSDVTDLSDMFRNVKQLSTANFNNWDTSTITNMARVFMASDFEGQISQWNLENVTSIAGMFRSADRFNDDISGWDTSKVTAMDQLFRQATNFNQNINDWDTSAVLTFFLAFQQANSFDQPLDQWDVSNSTSFNGMFRQNNRFNQDISGWNMNSATDVRSMFEDNSVFNQDLSGWALPAVTISTNFDNNASAWDCANRPASVKTCP